jgi:hypothetical protein
VVSGAHPGDYDFLVRPQPVDSLQDETDGIHSAVAEPDAPVSRAADYRVIVPFTPPSPRRPSERFILLQQWEGYVLDVTDACFSARLVDKAGGGDDLEAEFDLEEVDESDRQLLTPGAMFYWVIGYLDRADGRRRTSLIRFRRLPMWQQSDVQRAQRRSRSLKEDLGW